MDIVCPLCGAFHWLKEKTAGRIPADYKFESCCKNGDVRLDPLKDFPPYLQELLTSQESKANSFGQNIRQYNSALTFTSENYTPDRRPQIQHEITCFQIHGELYHLQGPLDMRNQEQAPQNAQLFFYDSIYATNTRMTRNSNLDGQVMHELTLMLQDNNPFLSIYLTARERLHAAAESQDTLRLILNPQMKLIMEVGADKRRENLPTSNQMAVIIPDEYGQSCFRDIVLATRNPPHERQEYTHIDASHAAYMPLHYVLLSPKGDLGFHWALKLRNDGER